MAWVVPFKRTSPAWAPGGENAGWELGRGVAFLKSRTENALTTTRANANSASTFGDRLGDVPGIGAGAESGIRSGGAVGADGGSAITLGDELMLATSAACSEPW